MLGIEAAVLLCQREVVIAQDVRCAALFGGFHRVRQCEELGEFAMAEHIREILIQEQEHLIDLATALGEDAPDVNRGRG